MRNLTENKILEVISHIEDLCYNLTYREPEMSPLIKRQEKPKKPEVVSQIKIDVIYNLTLSLLIKVYGESSEHLINFQSQLMNYNDSNSRMEYPSILNICLGKLEFLKLEIQFGLLTTIEKDISGEIVSDFLRLSRQAFDEGIIPVSAVLSCGALEDALKRFAKANALAIDDKNMSQVVNALKSKSLISGTQSSLLKTYVQIRNKAFHAEWDKIQSSDIKSVIGFTEEFISKNF